MTSFALETIRIEYSFQISNPRIKRSESKSLFIQSDRSRFSMRPKYDISSGCSMSQASSLLVNM
jgi:hypothetical protein